MTITKAEAAPGVWQIRLSYSNVYVLSEGSGSGFALVDAGTPRDARRLRRALAQFGGLERCSALLLTHAHPDHAGCAALLARDSGAPILAHESERPFLESKRLYGSGGLQAAAFKLGSLLWPIRPCRLSRALSDGEVVQASAEKWRVVHTPGHTRGHISFFRERDGVLLSGDALLNVRPWTRREGLTLPLRLFTQDAELALDSARKLALLQPRVLLPGHGGPLLDAAAPLRRFARA